MPKQKPGFLLDESEAFKPKFGHLLNENLEDHGLVIDDSLLHKSKFSPVCTFCQHFDVRSPLDGTPTCKAFPIKVPDEIWSGANDHTKPFPGDKGITFSRSK